MSLFCRVTESTCIGLEAELQELEDDIVTEATESFDDTRYGAPAFMRSEPINKLFIEQKSMKLNCCVHVLVPDF